MDAKVKIGSKSKVVIKWDVMPIDYSHESENAIKIKFAEKYGINKENIKVEPNFIKKGINGESVPFNNDIITDVQNPEFQQKLFKEYIKLKEITDYDFDIILGIDKQINSQINYELYDSNRKYTIRWIKWDNFMSYGSNNFFDFDSINGLTLLTSEPANQGGKSTFCLDLIRFLLFGKVTSRESDWSLAKVFNKHIPEATEVNVEGCITIDGVDYVIKRTVTRPALKKRTAKSKVTHKVSYYKLVNNEYIDLEDEENVNGSSTTETNKMIKEAIGNERDFDLMICVNSDNLKGLISLKDTERGRLIARWIGLLPLEEKDKIAREMFNKTVVPSLKMNVYSKASLEEQVKKTTEMIDENTSSISKAKEAYGIADKEITELMAQRDALLSSKYQIDDTLLKVDVNTVEAQIADTIEKGKVKRAEKENNEALYKEYEGIDNFDEDEYKAVLDEHEKYAVAVNTFKHKCEVLLKEKSALEKGEYCPTCGAKLKGVDNTEAIKAKDDEHSKLQERIEKGIKYISELDDKIKYLEEKRKNFNQKLRLQILIEKNAVDIENITAKYKEYKRLLKDIENNKSAIEKNNNIEIQIRLLNENIKVKNGIKNAQNNIIVSLEAENNEHRKNIETFNALIKTISEEEILVRNWKIYLEMIGKNGISKIVLRNALPLINGELYRMLNDICDFTVEVDIDDHNDVAFYLLHDGVKSNLASGSGFEQTVASLALRSVLGRISSFSKPSFVVFDEVLGGVSDENYDQVKTLFDKIAKDYKTVLQISHLKQLTDWHNNFIVVKKENNISKIVSSSNA